MRMRTLIFGVLAALFASAPARAEFTFSFDSDTQRWDLSNGVIHAVFQLGPDGKFQFQQIDDLRNGGVWKASDTQPSSPIHVRFDSTTYDAITPFRMVNQHVETPDANAARQVIVLKDLKETVKIQLDLEMYTGQPVLRHHVSVTNMKPQQAYARLADLLPYSFAADGQAYKVWRVSQWSILPRPQDFQASQTPLTPDGPAVSLLTGARGVYCTWVALRDQNSRGLFAGWEFDGQTLASVRQRGTAGTIQFAANIVSLYHPVAAGDTFRLPGGFIGVYQGDWDEAGSRTQRFTEAVLATPAADNFPYVSWDSWAYQENVDEATLRRNADAAAALGIELFVVDLGWSKQIGDWYEDPQKFPGGLHALSDYVHSLGMKFGLHFALTEAAPDAPVLQDHPDWTSSETYFYHDAVSLCLSNRPARQWLIEQAVRMIDDYGVDWMLQDGEDMVKHCTKSTHTHDPRDSNYANSVEGLNAVVAEVRRQRPHTVWENCENGGNMMTFNMVQNYVTSITNDGSGSLGSRQGVYGATYPFSPRFADRYMPEDPTSTYITRSYMFGGPWHLMNRLADLPPDATRLAAREIQIYKNMRAHIRDGKVFHVTPAPAEGRVDALESYTAYDDTAIAIVTRNGGAFDYADIKLQGLKWNQTYRVSFEDDRRTLSMTGQQLSQQGVRVNLPAAQIAEIVYVSPLQ